MERAGTVIVGAGGAGATAAGTLRKHGYPGRIMVVRGEPGRPYNRTTVSKSLLQGVIDADAVTLPEADTPEVEWTEVDPAVALDPGAHTVTLASGRSIRFDHLVIATGAQPRRLTDDVAAPGVRDRLLTLRTAADAARLRRWLEQRNGPGIRGEADVTILGAGLIGSEAAAVLSAAGACVHLISRSGTPMADHVGGLVASHLADLHRRHVDVRFGRTVAAVHADGPNRAVTTLTDGDQVSSSIVLVSTGVTPSVGWLSGSGAPAADGVAVDDRLRVQSAPGIYAAGDLARITDDAGRGRRVEHWAHALAQGRHAALALLHDTGHGEDPGPFDQIPRYSIQVYGTRLTVVGHPDAAAGETVLDGEPGEDKFTVGLTDVTGRLVRVVGVGGARVANALEPAIRSRVNARDCSPTSRSRCLPSP